MQQAANITYWIAFTAGILSFASPCVLPLIPSYLTYITGLSFSQLEDAHPNAKVRMTVLLHSLCFILGFTVVFVLLGAIAGVAAGGESGGTPAATAIGSDFLDDLVPRRGCATFLGAMVGGDDQIRLASGAMTNCEEPERMLAPIVIGQKATRDVSDGRMFGCVGSKSAR